jgi:hypothetical protein
MPNSPIEAANFGNLLILSDIPAHRELFEDDSVIWTKGSDPVALKASILKAVSLMETNQHLMLLKNLSENPFPTKRM